MKQREIERKLREAIEARDIKHGANYEQSYSLARRVSGIGLAEWDELLNEVDELKR